jgi:hypothetical protein
MPAAHRVHTTSSSSMTSAFACLHQARLSAMFPPTASRGRAFSTRQAFRNVAALQFACPPDRSAPSSGTRGRFHSSFPSIRYLLDSRVCYPADWPTAGAGLAPARKAAVVGCTIDLAHSAPAEEADNSEAVGYHVSGGKRGRWCVAGVGRHVWSDPIAAVPLRSQIDLTVTLWVTPASGKRGWEAAASVVDQR